MVSGVGGDAIGRVGSLGRGFPGPPRPRTTAYLGPDLANPTFFGAENFLGHELIMGPA